MGNMKGKLLLMAASLLGFGTACESGDDSSLTMYGTPYNRFLVKGTVSDPAGNPIPGIQVQNSQDPTAVETGSDGSFEISGRGLFNEAKIRFTDIDGPENGGEFSTRELQIKFTEEERTAESAGMWDQGAFARSGVEVTLEEKTTDAE